MARFQGLPAGCKFDPSDVELIKHLEGQVGISEPHMLIDEFIPTIKEVEGICYTHPENLPGIKKDGNCAHFFHKISNAYAIGPRKRRKINTGDINSSSVGWHKTGKTKPIIENGIQIGSKKIMVLYKNTKGGSKRDKANWVMHQYHNGTEREEKDGQIVVSKILYQLRKKRSHSNLEYADDKNGVQDIDGGGSVCLENEPQAEAVKVTDHVERSERSLCHEVLDPLEPFLDFDLDEEIKKYYDDFVGSLLNDIPESPTFGSQEESTSTGGKTKSSFISSRQTLDQNVIV